MRMLGTTIPRCSTPFLTLLSNGPLRRDAGGMPPWRGGCPRSFSGFSSQPALSVGMYYLASSPRTAAREVRHHGGDARRRRAPRRIKHQQQLHQMLLHRGHQRLDDEYIGLTAIRLELHAQTVVA